jgi:hypothetical protein
VDAQVTHGDVSLSCFDLRDAFAEFDAPCLGDAYRTTIKARTVQGGTS